MNQDVTNPFVLLLAFTNSQNAFSELSELHVRHRARNWGGGQLALYYYRPDLGTGLVIITLNKYVCMICASLYCEF